MIGYCYCGHIVVAVSAMYLVGKTVEGTSQSVQAPREWQVRKEARKQGSGR